MQPEGEAETRQPTPEEETDQTVRSTRRALWVVSSLVAGVTTQKDSTQPCPAQSDKGWSTGGLHYGKIGAAMGGESGSPSIISSSAPSKQVAILLQLK